MRRFYKVEYEFSDDVGNYRVWVAAPLEMCSYTRNCGCYEEQRMDICSNFFLSTDSLLLAKAEAMRLRKLGYKVRIVRVDE